MNPSFKFILALIISIEISIKVSLTTNLLIILFCIGYLLVHHTTIKKLLTLLLAPLIAAITVFATLYWFTTQPNLNNALSLSSRIYVYTLSIACVSCNTSAESLARSFEQNFKLPSKFAYGVLAALNIIPLMKHAVKQIRTAGMMRGVYLSFWSPVLYFKAILVALNSADNLAQGMESHGYREGGQRSIIAPITVKRSDWLWSILLLCLTNLFLFTLK
ncbi:energy-coupling factor transporter transmembrane component T [Lactobacillus sp. ESL0684]|uniref:energy-coupling factor transporter transmembrane component T family protein n=1 Tax=Lactobacillus sp. ESL0684 TaxID=2983213 RepID=UPI0023F63B10|nr:energy-coupling factor transporter transmembrane component T [Lactobacillus sp. ESL0684]WEV43740.1 energy-coupling factor transporter transmembrane component T [Lactobacillus sp. ESL0684]